MEIKKQKLVVLGIIKKGNKILLAQRIEPEVPAAHLKWDLVGGTNEFGESLEETLIREIKEEVNLDINVGRLIPKTVSKMWKHTNYQMHALIFGFICQYVSGDAVSNDPKIGHIEWCTVSEALSKDLLPTTRVILEEYEANNDL